MIPCGTTVAFLYDCFFTAPCFCVYLHKNIEVIEIASFHKLVVNVIHTEFLENRITVGEEICADTEAFSLNLTAD